MGLTVEQKLTTLLLFLQDFAIESRLGMSQPDPGQFLGLLTDLDFCPLWTSETVQIRC
jgi:hypothetical protein